MKKQYSKPGIIIENFTFSQNIANGCSTSHDNPPWGSPTQLSKTTCGWTDGLDTLWIAGPICSEEIDEDAEVDGICYNNPENGMSIFGSY